MTILLAVVIISVAEVVILSLAFRTFERADEKRARLELERAAQTERPRSRFFGEAAAIPSSDGAALEALLARLERHVRLEQQAAQWFLDNPTPETLHHRAPVRPHVTH
ncbi:MAG: hypothetical protein EHM24_04265 [Acidobacteria bacterium]|nr:MAG: hypothetical protein EHM24_09960 [Acidobacteriota bacterium]RPJ75454.1 MAG: hypothetical protein EHM24_04265 [Acidobacteriota bacterium]